MTKETRNREFFIKKGIFGNVFLVIQGAFDLAKDNVDEDGEPAPFEGTLLVDVKDPKNVVYSKGKETGTYWKLEENGDTFKNIRETAKAAMADIDKLAYTDKVKAAIDAFASIPNLGRGKGAGLKPDSLKGLKL